MKHPPREYYTTPPSPQLPLQVTRSQRLHQKTGRTIPAVIRTYIQLALCCELHKVTGRLGFDMSGVMP